VRGIGNKCLGIGIFMIRDWKGWADTQLHAELAAVNMLES
jgi:hypothetical protein